MSKSFRRRFTEWYVKKGYIFGYRIEGVPIIGYDLFATPSKKIEAYWICPIWVRPLLIFFSPSIYFTEFAGKNIVKYFKKSLEEGMKLKDRAGIDI